MKANEFFKAMGLKAVKQFLENDNIRTKEMHDELKRLVESHELVESYMGLDMAKHTLSQKHYLDNDSIWRKLEQAIADVESCQ